MNHFIALVLAAALAAPVAFADDAHRKPAAGASQTSGMSEGEVRKVDKDARRITIKHGPLQNLDMPGGMSMVFHVTDPALLDKVKAGDKVKFVAEKVGGHFMVTRIEAVN